MGLQRSSKIQESFNVVTKLVSIALLGVFVAGCSHLKSVSPSGVTPQARLQTRWIKPTVQNDFILHRKMNRMSPIVSEKQVFQGNNLGEFSSFNRSTGQLLWSRTFKGGVEAGAHLFKNQIFVAANDGTVSALNIKTGETIWSFSSSSENTSVPVLDPSTGLLYFQNSQNLVFCLEADTGRQVWVYSKPDNALMTIRGSSTPLVANGLVFVGFSEGSFVALRAQTGQVAWEQSLNRNKKFKDIDAQAVVVKNNRVIISGYDDRVYALGMSQGQILWSYPAGSYSAVTVDGDHFYVSTTQSELLKLSTETGELVWKLSGLQGLATQGAMISGYVVVGESQGSLKFVSRETGQVQHQFEPGRGIYSKPSIDPKSNEIYFISGEAYLYSLHLNEKSKESFLWSL